MRLSLQLPVGTLSPTTSLNTTNTDQSAENAYLDPYTTLAEGYRPRTTRWRLLVSKVQTTLHSKSRSTDLTSLAKDARPVASLTERNLTEFFDPDYSDEIEAFKDPKDRENPFDNPAKRRRVGQWIEGLPE